MFEASAALLDTETTEGNRPSGLVRVLDARPDQAALAGRLQAAKQSYVTRRFDLAAATGLLVGDAVPKAGDLVLARIRSLGHHRRLESTEGRRRHLYEGDEVLLCYGARYASDQFEALVPDALSPCHLVAAGGIAARCRQRHDATRSPTAIEPVGLVADEAGRPLNLRRFALQPAPWTGSLPPIVAVVGTAMNAGKTTTLATLVRGLRRDGQRVAVGKVTGTGAGGDRWAYSDAGADLVLDFSDFGYASTYRVAAEELEHLLDGVVQRLAAARPDVILLEVADGLFFGETAELVASSTFRRLVDGVMLAAGDAMGAEAAVRRLAALDIEPIAVAGRLTASPLAVAETRRVVAPPILGLAELLAGAWRDALPERLARRAS